MRNILFCIAIFLLPLSIYAQSGFTFQSVIRDADGEPQTNTTIYLKFEVLDESTSGDVLYSETHEPVTDDYGYISISVGEGTAVFGDYNNISWSEERRYLIVSCSDDNGSSYNEISSSLINSAPFVGPRGPRGEQGPAGQNGTGVKIIGSVATIGDLPNSYSGDVGDMYIVAEDGSGHVWDGSDWLNVGQIQGPKGDTGPAGVYTGGAGITISGNEILATDNSETNEIQTLEFTGTTLTLSRGGGTIELASLSGGISLPYYDEDSGEGAMFHIHNGHDKKHYGVAGTIGEDNDLPEFPGAGVLGAGKNGVFGWSESDTGSGVRGETEADEGYGVYGVADGDGIGGYFETDETGRAALATGEGNVGIGTKLPQSKLEIVDDTKTRLTLNSEESNGVSSLAFKQFQGIDSYQGWLWESDISDLNKPSFSLYDYNYLIGIPDNESKNKLYSIERNTVFGENRYTHSFLGKSEFRNVLELHGGDQDFTVLGMIPHTEGGIQKKFELISSHDSDVNSTKYQLDYLELDPITGFLAGAKENLYSATRFSNGFQRHDFGGEIYIKENVYGYSNLNLLVQEPGGERWIAQSANISDGIVDFSIFETYVAASGGGASTNPLYITKSNALLSPSGLGGNHMFYGHIQTDGFSMIDGPFSEDPDHDAKLYIRTNPSNDKSALHIDANNALFPAMLVHTDGVAMQTTGSVHINTDGGLDIYPLVMRQKSVMPIRGMLLQNGTETANNWELYVRNNGNLDLFFDDELRGSFNPDSGNYTSTSDARLKTNINSLNNVLPSLMNLSAKKYNYKSNLKESYNGFLAQDIQQIFPDVVTEVPSRDGEQSTLMVDYAQLGVLAIRAIQEQQEVIIEYEKRISETEMQLKTVLKRLEALEINNK